MKWRMLAWSVLLFSAPLDASILVLSNGLASPAWVQDFSSPSLTPGSKNGVAGALVTNQFSNVTVSAGNVNTPATMGLFYDPDGGGGCAMVAQAPGDTIVNMPANCVGNFINSNATASGLSVPNDPAGNPFPGPYGLPTIDIGFATGQTNIAFVLAAVANGLDAQMQRPLNTLVQVYDLGGNLIESQGIHTSLTYGSNGTNGYNWVTIAETTPVGKVVLSSTGLDETGQNGLYGTTPTPWAAQLSDIEGNAPEPATIGLFGLGLAAIGLLSRRRKA